MMAVEREMEQTLDYPDMLLTAAAMVEAIEYYLIEGNIFRIVMLRRTEGFERVTMSLGELLTLFHLLDAQAAQAMPEQRQRLDDMKATVQQIHRTLHDRFYEMVIREIMARLDRINWFLHDCTQGKDDCQLLFPTEISNRQRIEELIKVLGDEMTDDVADRIDRIDQRLRQSTRTTNFVWSSTFTSIYPPDPYWYLYVLPK